MGFQISLDIINRALQHLGRRRIYSLSDASAQSAELVFSYDKLRDAELRRNVWRFAIRRTILRPIGLNTFIWTPAAWSASTQYIPGSVVSFSPTSSEQGAYPISLLWYTDTTVTGGSTPDIAPNWHRYFGPVTGELFVDTVEHPPPSVFLGQVAGGTFIERTYTVALSYVAFYGETLASGVSILDVSANNLLTVTSPVSYPDPLSGIYAYNIYARLGGQTVLQNPNPIPLGTDWTEPTSGLVADNFPIPVAQDISYQIGDITTAAGIVHTNLYTDNPTVPGSNLWVKQGGTIVRLRPLYPLNTGPSTNLSTLNAFRLPYGFLRRAPQDPRADFTVWLGAPTGPVENDWLFEGDYLVSHSATPLLLRFVADVVDVPEFDPMFAEGLAARIAAEVAPSLVEPARLPIILSACSAAYRLAMTEARAANSILIGSESPPLDAYLAVRF